MDDADKLTREEMDEIEALANAATDGPWKLKTDMFGQAHAYDGVGDRICNERAYVPSEWRANMAFIAAAREALPRLIATARDAMDDAARLRKSLQEYDNMRGKLFERDELARQADAERARAEQTEARAEQAEAALLSLIIENARLMEEDAALEPKEPDDAQSD